MMIRMKTNIFLTKKKLLICFLNSQWTKTRMIESNVKKVFIRILKRYNFLCDDIRFLVCAEQKRKLKKLWSIWQILSSLTLLVPGEK